MDCKYCYETDKTTVFTWEQIKENIDTLIRLRQDDEFLIEFLGGEPLMAWDLLVMSYEYLESNSDFEIPYYLITTNGTIIGNNIIKYLQANPKLYIQISMDGNRWANQLRVLKHSRKNSYEYALENMKKFQDAGITTSVNMVIHPYNVYVLNKSIDELYALNIRYIYPGIVENMFELDHDFCEKYISEFEILSKRIIAGELPGLNVKLLNLNPPNKTIRVFMTDDYGVSMAGIHDIQPNPAEYIYNEYDKNLFISLSRSQKIQALREIVYQKYNSLLKEQEEKDG